MRSPLRPAASGLIIAIAAGVFLSARMPLPAQDDHFTDLRRDMVEQQIRRRGVSARGVLDAMSEVPRHLFLPEGMRDRAYDDGPQPIGSRQTISQPYIVALMTELLGLSGDERVLEIGTGSGYQAAILGKMARKVYTIEIREGLAARARELLTELGFSNIEFRVGDGYAGWPEEAPFDGIIVTAAPREVPESLLAQLRIGGRMVIPVGNFFQQLLVITRTKDGFERREVAAVRFVPMVSDPDEN